MRKVFAFIVLLALQVPQTALAHAALISTDPAGGGVLSAAPDHLTLTFNEPVAPLAFRWIGPDGAVQMMPDEGVHSADGTVTVALPAGLERGTQTLSWRVASADGHPVGGTLSFAIGATTGDVSVSPQSSALPVAAARWALTVALVLGVGGAVFLAFVAGGTEAPLSRRVAFWSATGAVPIACLAAGLHGADMLGQAPPSLFGSAPWLAVAAAPFARTAALSVVAAVLALGAVGSTGRMRDWLASLAWILAALSFAASGHATTPLKGVALTFHALTAIFWIGALPGLAVGVGRRDAVPVLRRFSALAVPLVILLIGSGIALVLTEADTISAFGTAWGRLLMVKLLFVASMIALAVLNRQRLTPGLAAGRSAKPLRRSIWSELILGLVVLALASGFRLTGTPTPEASSNPGPMLHLHSTQAMAKVTFASGARGPNGLSVEIADGDFGPLVPKEVAATLSLPSAGIEKLRLSLQQTSTGIWAADQFTLPVAGGWDLTLRLLIDDFTSIPLESTVEISP